MLHNILERQIKLNNQEMYKMIEGIDASKKDHAMFKATRLLNQKTFENHKAEDSEVKLVSRPRQICGQRSRCYTTIPKSSKTTKKKIKAEKVRKSFDSLSNNKASGEENVIGELLKYGTPLLDKTIANIYNTGFEKP